MKDKRWNRLERGEMGTAPFFASLLLCWRGGLAGETGGGNFNYLLFYLFYYGKR